LISSFVYPLPASYALYINLSIGLFVCSFVKVTGLIPFY